MNQIIQEDLDFILSNNLPWESFFGKTVLISGANGLLPSYLVETLLYLNQKNLGTSVKVIGIVRNIEKAKVRFKSYENRSDLVLINQDICEPIQYDKPVDYIIHAASQASPKYYGLDPVGTLNANIIGTKNLLEFARKNNPMSEFLLFSSGEVYGVTHDSNHMIKESDYGYIDPTNVRSCYAESKRMAETMCICWSHQYGISVKIVRPFHTYGPMMLPDDGRVFADFVFDIVNNRNIVMKSDGSTKRVFCYISDATIGFFTVLLKGKIREAYNVAGNAEVSILELANLLIDLFPEKNLKLIREIRTDNNHYLVSPIQYHFPDTSKLKQLDWNTRYTLNDGFKRTIESYL